MLVKIGFKEIEVAYPCASQNEFNLVRYLIENNEIPDGVGIQVRSYIRDPCLCAKVRNG